MIVGLIQRWYELTDPKDIKPEKADNASSHESEEKGDEVSHSAEKNPDSGVFIGGVRLDTVDTQWWRMNVNLVQQEPFLFNDTIFNNVVERTVGHQVQRPSEGRKDGHGQAGLRGSLRFDLPSDFRKATIRWLRKRHQNQRRPTPTAFDTARPSNSPLSSSSTRPRRPLTCG